MDIRTFLARARRGAGALIGGAALALGAAPLGTAEDTRPKQMPYETPGQVPLLNPEYRKSDHRVVLITDDRLSPRRVELESGQLVAWISYSRAPTTIVFEREVAKSMICHSLVNFYLKEDELRSGEIHAGEFASFCQLKPGRYRYKVTRQREESARSVPVVLEGEIVVAEPEAGEETEEG
ncbi:MAG: hypothetical protein JSU66_01120 [Deltaproteobacteria bacterium]|nr:MAG: hypothetical protein JSU66_01120 [Deltaproteobacteria bacterium]